MPNPDTADYQLISADSHVSEPPDLWVTRVDRRYRERAPRLVTDLPGKEGAYFLYEGYAPHPIGIGLGAGKSPEELKEFLTKATYADARATALRRLCRGRMMAAAVGLTRATSDQESPVAGGR